jgi:hypothetical protein
MTSSPIIVGVQTYQKYQKYQKNIRIKSYEAHQHTDLCTIVDQDGISYLMDKKLIIFYWKIYADDEFTIEYIKNSPIPSCSVITKFDGMINWDALHLCTFKTPIQSNT